MNKCYKINIIYNKFKAKKTNFKIQYYKLIQ